MFRKVSLFKVINNHGIDYPSPINLTMFWSIGSLALVCLVVQLITGIFLAMHYTSHIDYAFTSIEHIMRDVNNGWLMRYIHANGASMFFITTYVHMFKNLYYGSFTAPRHWLWMSGVIIFLLMMGTAFFGYVLPWGQMSFWGATVITNLIGALPLVGPWVLTLLWGGFAVDNPTLNRIFSIHYLLPFVILGLVIVHLVLLHMNGNNNPLGIETKTGFVPFYPYFIIKDAFGMILLFIVFCFFVFFFPNYLGHSDNYILANPMVTPAHIVPEWYFLPYYAILRSIPHKLLGVLAMFGSILVWLIIPFLMPKLHIRSSLFRPIVRKLFWFHFFNFLLLGWIGQNVVETPFIEIGQFCTVFYFLYYLVFLPLFSRLEYDLLLQGK